MSRDETVIESLAHYIYYPGFFLIGYVTRGEMAAFIMRSLYGENFSYTAAPYFDDVPADQKFFKYGQKIKDTAVTAISGNYMVRAWAGSFARSL